MQLLYNGFSTLKICDYFYQTGYVGNGMLTAAVAGAVFASPPAGNVLAAIRAAHSSSNGSVLR